MTTIFIADVQHPPFLRCPNCGSDDSMKNGTTRRDNQNYNCREALLNLGMKNVLDD